MIYYNNPMVKGARGKIGNMVFRQINGLTVASKIPAKPDKSKETASQRATRTRFRETAILVKDHLLFPEVKEHYERIAKGRSLPSAYHAAMGDYLKRMAGG